MEIEEVLKWGGGFTAGGIALRMLLTWFRKQNSGDHLLAERDLHMAALKGDLKDCKDAHAEKLAEIEAIREQNTLLRIQNAMMRQMLLAKGVTEAELIAIGAMH